MHSYHNVAELRQFRGASPAAVGHIHRRMAARCQSPERIQAPPACPGMERFFLAIMVAAVLLLIVAADLLVNGPGIQQPSTQIANALPVSGRLIR